MNNDVVKVEDLNIEIENHCKYEHLSFSVKHKEIVSIIGANKCGKSTFMKILSGYIPTNDQIKVGNISLNEKSRLGFLKKVGYIHQDKTKSDRLVKAYIEEELDKKKDKAFFKKMIELFQVENLLNSKVSNLSKDDFVRVLFCRNLVKRPSVLFIDYTTLDISKGLKKSLESIYPILKEEDISIVYTTNDPKDFVFSDTTYVMHAGKIALYGKTKEVLKEDGLLLKLGIELPFEVDLSLKLQMYNLVDKIYYDIDELVDYLWK